MSTIIFSVTTIKAEAESCFDRLSYLWVSDHHSVGPGHGSLLSQGIDSTLGIGFDFSLLRVVLDGCILRILRNGVFGEFKEYVSG
jgi:hypothetical protein